jgi:RNA polymerase sigma-70 factor (ECF subfamily)
MSHPPLGASLESVALATDSRLLERYVETGEQAAFTELVRRHGPMVLAACRRVLSQEQDAEDALQATFIILARKASTLDRSQPLAAWLYTVAYQTALNARGSAAARRHRELHQAMNRPTSQPPDESHEQQELRRLLDEELHRLPEEYRTPVVLCYLDGQTNEEAARQLAGTRRDRQGPRDE